MWHLDPVRGELQPHQASSVDGAGWTLLPVHPGTMGRHSGRESGESGRWVCADLRSTEAVNDEEPRRKGECVSENRSTAGGWI